MTEPETTVVTEDPDPTGHQPVYGPVAPAPVIEERRRSKRPLLVLVAVLMLVVGAGAGWAALADDGDDGAPTANDASVQNVAKSLGPSVVHIESAIGVGSGVVVGESLVLTAAHVVMGVDEVTVKEQGGAEYDGRIVGRATERDLAVVAIEDDGALPAATLGTEPVEVGQEVVALGSPFGFDQSVTSGIVSGLDRELDTPFGLLTGLIQTDTAINPGNSGGPLADLDGKVAGIVTSIASMTGSNDGVGFAVPIADATSLLEDVHDAGGADAPTASETGDDGGGFEFDVPPIEIPDLELPNLDDFLSQEDVDSLLQELEDAYNDLESELGPEIDSLLDEFLDMDPFAPPEIDDSGILDLSALRGDYTTISSQLATIDVNGESIATEHVALDGPDGPVLLAAERGDGAADRFDGLDGDDVALGDIDAKVHEEAGSARYAWMIGDDVLVIMLVPEGTSADDVTALAEAVQVQE